MPVVSESEEVKATPPDGDALFVAMTAVGHVAKDSQGHGYKYRGIEAIMQAARPALRAARMSCYPVDIEVLERESRASSRGAAMVYTMVRITFRYASPDQSFDVKVIGEAFDTGDKGMAKAISVAQRTAHILALQIPTGEDTELGEQHEASSGPAEEHEERGEREERGEPAPISDKANELVDVILATTSERGLDALVPLFEDMPVRDLERLRKVFGEHRGTIRKNSK